MSNELLLVARRKAEMLDALLIATEDFEQDEPINGADFVEFFAGWRGAAVTAIRELEGAYKEINHG